MARGLSTPAARAVPDRRSSAGSFDAAAHEFLNEKRNVALVERESESCLRVDDPEQVRAGFLERPRRAWHTYISIAIYRSEAPIRGGMESGSSLTTGTLERQLTSGRVQRSRTPCYRSGLLGRKLVDVAIRYSVLLFPSRFTSRARLDGAAFWDTTARDLGRISLNPLRHIDPIGTGAASAARHVFGRDIPLRLGRNRHRSTCRERRTPARPI
jgi:hypothetical protein